MININVVLLGGTRMGDHDLTFLEAELKSTLQKYRYVYVFVSKLIIQTELFAHRPAIQR